MTETSKYRAFTERYCYRPDGLPGCGIDLGSQGDPIVSWCWQLDLPKDKFKEYNGTEAPLVQLRGDAFAPFVEDGSLDFVYSSHLLEDRPFADWPAIIRLWARALKPGGHLIILVPEARLWKQAVERGQPPNDSHKHEAIRGELSSLAGQAGLTVVVETLTNVSPEDYTLMFVGRRI